MRKMFRSCQTLAYNICSMVAMTKDPAFCKGANVSLLSSPRGLVRLNILGPHCSDFLPQHVHLSIRRAPQIRHKPIIMYRPHPILSSLYFSENGKKKE